jgi:hypothetical protein
MKLVAEKGKNPGGRTLLQRPAPRLLSMHELALPYRS